MRRSADLASFVFAQIRALLQSHRVGVRRRSGRTRLCRLCRWQRCARPASRQGFPGAAPAAWLLSIIFRCDCLKSIPQPGGEPIDFILHDPTSLTPAGQGAQQRRFSFFVSRADHGVVAVPSRLVFVGEVAAHVMPLVPLATRQASISAGFSGSGASRWLLSIIFRCNCLKSIPQLASEPIDILLHDPLR
jgi:hypothetical protein